MGYQYKYLNIRKGENSYIISSEVYKFRIEFSYDDDGVLQLHSFFGPGISLDDLDELEQFVMEEFEEDFPKIEEDLVQFAKECKEKGEQNAFEFHYEKDLKNLNKSPEKFFLTYDIKKHFGISAEAEKKIPEELKKQINEYYKVEYVYCSGYPIAVICGIQNEYSEILSIPSSPCGILFFDIEHIYGVIAFEGFKRAFADVWNRQRGPNAPKIYPTDSKSMYLVKKFTANESGKIAETGWDYFFSNFSSTVTRAYNEFMNR